MAQRGFIFIEVLVASAIFIIAFMSISEMVLNSIKLAKNAEFTTTASMLAQQKLEELRALAYDDPGLTAVNTGSPQEDPVVGYPDMSRLWIIEDDLPYAGVKRITVTVSARRSAYGGTRATTLASFKAASLLTEPVTQ